jgi:hypothetical protein
LNISLEAKRDSADATVRKAIMDIAETTAIKAIVVTADIKVNRDINLPVPDTASYIRG